MLLRLMVLLLTLATVQSIAFGQGRAAADTMPSRDQIAAASARVRDIFATEAAAAKTPQQKSALAQTMLSLAQETQDPAEAYVLLDSSRRMAIDAKDARTMDRAMKSLDSRYRVNFVKERRDALLSMAKTAPLDGLGFVVDALVADAEALKQASRLDEATDLATAAAAAARRGRDAAKQKQTTSLLDELKARSRDQAVIQPALDKLAQNPRDPQAAFEVGKHRCFVEGNWDAGLPLLVISSDRTLAQLAQADLNCDESSASHTSLGDAWFAYHEKFGSKQSTGGASRARYHYEQALSDAAGLDRAIIAKKLEAIAATEGPSSGGWTVVFRSADPAIWNTDTNSGYANFAVKIDSVPPTVRYVRIRRANGEAVVLPITKQELTKEVYGPQYGWVGGGLKIYSDMYFGVCLTSKPLPMRQGDVIIGRNSQKFFSGWGFGHAHQGGPTNMAWNGMPVPKEPLEISVLDRELSAKEKREVTLLQ
jgi:hypothetical protein